LRTAESTFVGNIEETDLELLNEFYCKFLKGVFYALKMCPARHGSSNGEPS